MRRLEQQNILRRKSERENAEAHASWVKFWKEIAEHLDDVFADARANNTAWNFWQAMARSGSNSRATGWNRRFIEQQFGSEVADRLRAILMRIWRKDKPTLRSERPAGEKNRFLVRWQLGLAAIYAEAEDPQWATKLSDDEALLAARFAPIQLNGFPSWLEALVAVHPEAVDAILGNELGLALREAGRDSDPTILLQDVLHASPAVMALFSPRIKAWLDEVRDHDFKADDPMLAHVSQAVDILMQLDDAVFRQDLRKAAAASLAKGLDAPASKVWLPVLMQLDPKAGVEALETGLESGNARTAWCRCRLDWYALWCDYRGATIDLRRGGFSPDLLLRLVRLAYKHVRPADDVHHEGATTPPGRQGSRRGRPQRCAQRASRDERS